MWSLSGHNSLGLQIILLPPFNLIFILRTQFSQKTLWCTFKISVRWCQKTLQKRQSQRIELRIIAISPWSEPQ